MDDDRRWERVALQQAIHALPGDLAVAVAAAQPFPPEFDGPTPEALQRITVAGDPVGGEVTPKFLTPRAVLIRPRLMADLAEP